MGLVVEQRIPGDAVLVHGREAEGLDRRISHGVNRIVEEMRMLAILEHAALAVDPGPQSGLEIRIQADVLQAPLLGREDIDLSEI